MKEFINILQKHFIFFSKKGVALQHFVMQIRLKCYYLSVFKNRLKFVSDNIKKLMATYYTLI